MKKPRRQWPTPPTTDQEARAAGWESLADFAHCEAMAKNWFGEFGPVGIAHVCMISDLDGEAWLHAPRAEVRKLLTRKSRRAMYETACHAQPGDTIAPQPQSTRQ
jgi:hypothetical protein